MTRLQKLLTESDYNLLVHVTKLYKSGDVSEATYLDFLTRHVHKQNKEIEDLKITIRLLNAKNELLEDFETDTYLENKN